MKKSTKESMLYFIDKGMPTFTVKTFNLGQGNTQPALIINWEDGSTKKLLLHELDALESFTLAMSSKHIRAYRRLVDFSAEHFSKKFAYVHRIISNTLMSH